MIKAEAAKASSKRANEEITKLMKDKCKARLDEIDALIKETAEDGRYRCYWSIKGISSLELELIEDELSEAGYKVCFASTDLFGTRSLLLISWEE